MQSGSPRCHGEPPELAHSSCEHWVPQSIAPFSRGGPGTSISAASDRRNHAASAVSIFANPAFTTRTR